MTTFPTTTLTAICAALSFSLTAGEIPSKRIQFTGGSTSATAEGSITGQSVFDYLVEAKAGQTMNIELNSESSFQYFNIIPPGDVEALFVGSRSGNKFAGILPTSGDYTVRLYLMGNAADTGQTATHKLKISIVGKNGEASPPAAFEKKLSLLGITFVVRSVTDEDGKNRVIVIPNGLKRANATVEAEIDGNIVGAEVGDLNVDSAPEIYVYTRSTDEAQRGTLHAWSSNRNLSLSPIYIPSPSEDAKNFEGYHGKDEFAVVESTLVRRFPISDISEPKTRQLQYKLHAGEATWQLKVDRVVVY